MQEDFLRLVARLQPSEMRLPKRRRGIEMHTKGTRTILLRGYNLGINLPKYKISGRSEGVNSE